MKKNIVISLISLSLQALFCTSVFAASPGSSVTITANVVASPCTIAAVSQNLAIPLGDIQASVLAAANSFSAWSPDYTISLTNCPSTTTKVDASFTGTADPADTNGYKNAASGGSADVATELAKSDGSLLKNGTSFGDATVSNGVASFIVKARLFSKAGSVTPGAVSSAVTVNFTYK
jgi:type 1 fimbria pilin